MQSSSFRICRRLIAHHRQALVAHNVLHNCVATTQATIAGSSYTAQQLTKADSMAGKAVMFAPKEAISPQRHMPLLQQILQMEAYRQQRARRGWEWGPSPARTARRAHGYFPWEPQEHAPESANGKQASGRDKDAPIQRLYVYTTPTCPLSGQVIW